MRKQIAEMKSDIIENLLLQGYDADIVAKIMNLSTERVRQVRQKSRSEYREKRNAEVVAAQFQFNRPTLLADPLNRGSESSIQTIISLYLNGFSNKEISEKTGKPESWIIRVIEQYEQQEQPTNV